MSNQHTPEPWPSEKAWAEWFKRASVCLSACAGMEDPTTEIAKLRADNETLREMQTQNLQEWARVVAENKKLRDYAIWVLSHHPDGDIDGGELQDMSYEIGMLEKFEVTEPCEGNCNCVDYGFPCECYRIATWLKDATDAKS